MFKSETQIYQEALKSAGYKENIVYKENRNLNLPKRKPRSKNVIWFNPPFSESVKTNVGAKFLALVEKHFKNTELSKYFNRSTVKISYSCLPNISAIIAGANKKVIKEYMNKDKIVKECNCRGGSKSCPLGGFCQEEEIVYKAEVKTDNKSHSYIGLASTTFKERYANHTSSFNHSSKRYYTNLSKYIWDLMEKKKEFEISWTKVGNAPAYNPISKHCRLCILEKTMILNADEKTSLNRRTELMNKCPHRRKFLLSTL